jgi:glycosyltransferase involved in cell wall biosynthesis
MDEPLDLTVLIATRNEAANIGACLDSLVPVRRVLVVDSGSRDGTAERAAARGAEVFPFAWNGRYPRKRQWALDTLDVRTAWIALLDADESVPPALWDDVRAVLHGPAAHAAYLAEKEFHFLGRRLRHGGFAHRAVFRFRTGRARFENLLPDVGEGLDMEVHERLIVEGTVGTLPHPLRHRDAKGLDAYVARHNAYATWEAALRYRFLTTGDYGESAIRPRWNGNVQERRRFLKRLAMRLPAEPWAWFLYHFVLRGGFREGRRGLIAAQLRRAYIEQVRAKVCERRLAAAGSETCGSR